MLMTSSQPLKKIGLSRQNSKTHTKEALKKISERSKGQNHPNSKLTEEDVLLIREYYTNKTYNQKEMSKMFKVSYSLIQKITQRVLWQHI